MPQTHESRRIPGNPGREPQPGVTPPPAEGGSSQPPSARTGVLRLEGDRMYVEVGGERIWLDPRQTVDTLRGLGPTPAGARVTRAAPSALAAAVAAAQRHRAELEAIDGVVTVRAGYQFEKGRITKTPCLVVAVAPGTSPALPPSLEGVPGDVTPAAP